MVRRFLASTCAVVSLLAGGGGLVHAQTSAPPSRTLSLDVWVRDAQGQPAGSLTPADFVVQIDGQSRRVTSARFVTFSAADSADLSAATQTSASSTGRSVAVVFDDLSFEGDEDAPLREAAARWLVQLHPRDRVAVVRTTKTTSGRVDVVGAAEAAAGIRVAAVPSSPAVVGRDTTFGLERRTVQQVESIARAVSWLAAEPGPRVLVVVSKGMAWSLPATRYLSPSFRIAHDAGISVHVVAPEISGSSSSSPASGWDSVPAEGPRSPGNGIDQIAAGLGGRVLRTRGTGDDTFAAIHRAVSGVYHLDVDVTSAALQLPELPVVVSVRPAGLVVRTGALAKTPAGRAAPRTAADHIRDILAGVDVAGDIPFDAVALLSRDTTAPVDQLQLTISVVLPPDLPSPVRVTLGLLDETGTLRFSTVDVPDVATGSRRASAATAVAPGWHRLTLVAEDGSQRLGSLTYGVHGRLRVVGNYTAADPRVLWRGATDIWQMLGGEALPAEAVVAASLFDLYPSAPDLAPPPLPLRLETAAGREVATQTLTPTSVGEGWRYSSEVRLDGLPPDEYVISLDTTAINNTVERLTQRFHKVTPAAVSLAAVPAPPPLPDAADLLNLFRAGVRDNWPRFASEDLLVADLLNPQLKALAGSRPLPPALASATGDDWWTALRTTAAQRSVLGLAARGLVALRDGDSRAAESHLRDAVADSPSSVPLRRLLGIAYAASGRDDAAAGVWGLAMGEGAADPRWSVLFAEALGRTGDFQAALQTLRQMPGEPTGPRVHRLIETLIVIGLMDEARDILSAWEAGEGQGQPAARPMFYLVALRYAAALQPGADDTSVAAFRQLADRYVAAGGEYSSAVTPWIQSVAALPAR